MDKLINRIPSLRLSASLAMSTSFFKALPGKFDIKRHSFSILYQHSHVYFGNIAGKFIISRTFDTVNSEIFARILISRIALKTYFRPENFATRI